MKNQMPISSISTYSQLSFSLTYFKETVLSFSFSRPPPDLKYSAQSIAKLSMVSVDLPLYFSTSSSLEQQDEGIFLVILL
jgi:hypothetical protein